MRLPCSFTDYLHNRQIIITTHSPTLTQCVNDENVYMLNNGQIVDSTKQQIIEEVTGEFWNKHQQNSFISSKKPIILLVEGKHDKEHITNAYLALKEEFSDLDFEIFRLNSETNIQPFLRGLYESEFDKSKIFVGLFDKEDKILKDFQNPKNYSKIEGRTFFKILESDKPNENYFVTTLPEIEDKKCDCSIEMMYDYSKWEEAFQIAVQNTLGKTTNKSIKKYSEDVLNDAKNLLSANSKNFKSADFYLFRKLFNLIREIKEFSNANKSATVKPERTKTTAEKKIIEIPKAKKSAKENHLAYWTTMKEYVETQTVSFKFQKPQAKQWANVTIGSSKFRLALIANTREKFLCIQLRMFTNEISDFRRFRTKYEVDSKRALTSGLEWREIKGAKEHHVNLVFPKQDPMNEQKWNEQHKLLCKWTEEFYNYFKDRVLKFDDSSKVVSLVGRIVY
jgi:hypothetical protein